MTISRNAFWKPHRLQEGVRTSFGDSRAFFFVAGPQVHRGLHGRELCRRGHLGLGEDVGGIRPADAPRLSPVDGLRPHGLHHRLGEATENGNPLRVPGPGPGGPRSQALAADDGERENQCWLSCFVVHFPGSRMQCGRGLVVCKELRFTYCLLFTEWDKYTYEIIFMGKQIQFKTFSAEP